MSGRRWIDRHDFADLRKQSGLTRREAAEALNVTPRTIQNWETGGARIPWMAYRMLRILRGFALPSVHWEGWTVRGHQLFSPTGCAFDAVWLLHNEFVFAQARLWRQMYAASGRAKTASTVVSFPDLEVKTIGGGYGPPPEALQFPERRRVAIDKQKPPQGHLKRFGGTR